MNIILVPGKKGRGRNACFATHQMVLVGVTLLLFLPALLGTVAYRVQALYAETTGAEAALTEAKQTLAAQRAAYLSARAETTTHLNALALKLGQLQAQVLRLNALGQRLTRMAGLDAREFNFELQVAQGGPEALAPASPGSEVTASLEQVGREIARSQARLAALESLLIDRKITAQVTPKGWPTDGGWVSSRFGLRADPFTGRRAHHEGVDIAARLGSPVRAMGDGIVTHAGPKAGYGGLVEVTHESGLTTRYAHTSKVLVKVGDVVSRGDVIAEVGTSGRSTGPHLHFEVRRNGRATDPIRYLGEPNSTKISATQSVSRDEG